MLARRSELPIDKGTVKALENHKRMDPYLTANAEATAASNNPPLSSTGTPLFYHLYNVLSQIREISLSRNCGRLKLHRTKCHVTIEYTVQ